MPFTIPDIVLVALISGAVTLVARWFERRKTSAEIERLDTERDLSRTKLLADMQAQIEIMANEIKGLRIENDKLFQDKDTATKAEGALREELNRFHDELERNEKINASLATELQVVRAENAVLQKKIIDKELEKEGLNAVILQLRSELDTLQIGFSKVKEDTGRLRMAAAKGRE